jgi:antitoxin (DNA-binding transcriptional repressor) of toxin-antitoxin stability system
MEVSLTQFKRHCLEIIRRVERSGESVAITHRGSIIARLHPPGAPGHGQGVKPWERLRSLGGRLLAAPSESVLKDEEFEARR